MGFKNPDHDEVEPTVEQQIKETAARNKKSGYTGYTVPMTDKQLSEWKEAVNKARSK